MRPNSLFSPDSSKCAQIFKRNLCLPGAFIVCLKKTGLHEGSCFVAFSPFSAPPHLSPAPVNQCDLTYISLSSLSRARACLPAPASPPASLLFLGGGLVRVKAQEARHLLPPCYALAVSGLPPREQLFNGSLCHDAGALFDFQVRTHHATNRAGAFNF